MNCPRYPYQTYEPKPISSASDKFPDCKNMYPGRQASEPRRASLASTPSYASSSLAGALRDTAGEAMQPQDYQMPHPSQGRHYSLPEPSLYPAHGVSTWAGPPRDYGWAPGPRGTPPQSETSFGGLSSSLGPPPAAPFNQYNTFSGLAPNHEAPMASVYHGHYQPEPPYQLSATGTPTVQAPSPLTSSSSNAPSPMPMGQHPGPSYAPSGTPSHQAAPSTWFNDITPNSKYYHSSTLDSLSSSMPPGRSRTASVSSCDTCNPSASTPYSSSSEHILGTYTGGTVYDAPSPGSDVHASGREVGRSPTYRKRRVDPSLFNPPYGRSAHVVEAAPSPEEFSSGRTVKKLRKHADLPAHVHSINVTCPHPDCKEPITVDEEGSSSTVIFPCLYVEPSSGRPCPSEFRRRGCRDRHSGSHSGREAQDVSAHRMSLSLARRVLWETIRLIDTSDWTCVYPPQEGDEARISDWTAHYEMATAKIREEFDVTILKQQAGHVREALLSVGENEQKPEYPLSLNPLPSHATFPMEPIDLSHCDMFCRLAMKRSISFERFYCRYPRCESDFTRLDALVRHGRTCHQRKKKSKAKRSKDDESLEA